MRVRGGGGGGEGGEGGEGGGGGGGDIMSSSSFDITTTATETTWPTDVMPADKAKAPENEDVKKETADETVGGNGLFGALAMADGGGGSSSSLSTTLNNLLS